MISIINYLTEGLGSSVNYEDLDKNSKLIKYDDKKMLEKVKTDQEYKDVRKELERQIREFAKKENESITKFYISKVDVYSMNLEIYAIGLLKDKIRSIEAVAIYIPTNEAWKRFDIASLRIVKGN